MYGHPQGGRFMPNITSIPGQNYVYHSPSGVHPVIQHTQIAPSSTLNQTGSPFTQPQTTSSIASPSLGYHITSPTAVSTPIQPHYITPVETIHPIQTPSISIKIEKSAEDAASVSFQRTQNTNIIQKDFNHAQPHQVLTTTQQEPTIVVQDATHLVRNISEQDASMARQQATKIILQQQQAQQQHAITLPEVSLPSQVQKEQHDREERERREKEIQRQKIIEDHQKQKNSNRIFSNSTKNLNDVIKFNAVQSSNKNSMSSSGPNSTLQMSGSPSEHGFRKIAATTSGPSNPPKAKSPAPHIDVKLYKCIMCGYLAESAALLGRHAFEMHEKRSRKWRIGQKFPVRHECDECDYETPDIHRLHRHMQRVHDTDQVFHFQCKACDFIATSADLLGRHALEVHEAGSVFRCSLCDFTSNRKSDRDKHFTGAHQLDYDTHMTSSGGTLPSRQIYICLVESCKEQIHGDKLQEHYKKLVRFDLLDEDNDIRDKKLFDLDRKEAEHTQYFVDENLDAHSIPGYNKHKKLPHASSSSDAETSFDNNDRRKHRKRRGRPITRNKRIADNCDETESDEEEKELKNELKELGVQQTVETEKESDASNFAYNDKNLTEKTLTDINEEEKETPVISDVIAKTIEKVLDRSENSNQKEEVFPKKCNLCCEVLKDKLIMIDHIRKMHMLKTGKKLDASKPKFEVIRQKPSKCLKIIREETSKCN